MTWLLTIGVFLATATLVWTALSMLFSDERTVSRRLDQLSTYESNQAAGVYPVLTPVRERVIAPMGRRITGGLTAIAPTGYSERTRHRLVLAGTPRGMGVGRLLAIKVFSALGAAALGLAIAALAGASTLGWIALAGFVILAFIGPDLWLHSAVGSRQTTIRRQLPDFLDMLTISVEAGLGFDAAIAKLVRSTTGPLAQEFGRMLQEIQAGVDRADALKRLSARTEVPELDSFLTAIVQAESFGISIANVLRTQAREMRLKRRQYAEEQGQKAPVKIVFPLVLCVLPATLIVILGPAVVSVGRVFGLL